MSAPTPIRSNRVRVFTRQLERERFVQHSTPVSEFEQALVAARSEIEMALRRFAQRIQDQESEVA